MTLPRRCLSAAAMVLRIPESGGLASSPGETCRGQLLLHITPGTRAPDNVTLMTQPALRGTWSISRAPWVVLAIVFLAAALVALMGGH